MLCLCLSYQFLNCYNFEIIINRVNCEYESAPQDIKHYDMNYLGNVHASKKLLTTDIQAKVMEAVDTVNLLFPKHKCRHAIRMAYLVTALAHLNEL